MKIRLLIWNIRYINLFHFEYSKQNQEVGSMVETGKNIHEC